MKKNLSPRIIPILFVLFFYISGVLAQNGEKLSPGKIFKSELADSQTGHFDFEASENSFAEIEIEKGGATLLFEIFAPGGERLWQAENSLFKRKYTIPFIAPQNGTYKLSIKPAFEHGEKITFSIELKNLREPLENDKALAEIALRESERQIFVSRKEFVKAFETAEKALQTARENNLKFEEAEILYALATLEDEKRSFEKALQNKQKAREIFVALGDKFAEANIFFGIAFSLQSLNRFDEAIENYRKCDEAQAAFGQASYRAVCNLNIGALYQNQAKPLEAVTQYQRVIELLPSGFSNIKLASYNNLANLYALLGETSAAIRTFGEYVRTAEKAKFPPRAFVYTRLGYLYFNLQDFNAALEAFKKGNELSVLQQNRSEEILSLVGIGSTYGELGETEKSLKFLAEALQKSRTNKDKLGEGAALLGIGNFQVARGDNQTAVNNLTAAHEILRVIFEPQLQIKTLNLLGTAHLGNGDLTKAEESFRQATEIAARIGEQTQEIPAFYGLAKIEKERGNLEKSLEFIEKSVTLAESRRVQIPSDSLRISFLASTQDAYEFYIDLLLNLHQKSPTAGFARKAFETAERARARSLITQLNEANIDIRTGANENLLAREKRLRQELHAQNALRLQQARNFLTPKTQIEATKEKINRLTIEYNQINAEIRAENPAFAALTTPAPLTFAELQKNCDPETLVLQYALGEGKSRVFALTDDAFEVFELPKRADIEAQVRRVREFMTAREIFPKDETPALRNQRIKKADENFTREAENLSKILLLPLNGKLNRRKLLIVPHGALQFLPFAALFAPNESRKYLVETHEISVLPSLSALIAQRESATQKMPASKTLAVFADAVYEADDPRLTKSKTVAGEKKSATRGNEEESFFGENERNFNFSRLIFSRREALQILNFVPNPQEKFAALDFSANLNAATSANLAQYRYLHFAAHGIFDAENPAQSSVILSLIDEKGNAQNGLLNLQEIYNLKLNAELTVLSACRTGLGKQVRGEGVIGLTRGFFYAGSRRVVASLWKVQDDATADLMTEFYRGLLIEKKRPADALRQTQLKMLAKPNFNTPFFWASFVHFGDLR